MSDMEKVVKIWIRISGASEEEAVGVKVPNKDTMTIGELKEAMLPLVSFDDFPISVEKIEAQHLSVTCEDEELKDDDMVFRWVDETLVVAPTPEACAVKETRASLAVLWEDLPTSLSMPSPTSAPGSPGNNSPPPPPELPTSLHESNPTPKPAVRRPSTSAQPAQRRSTTATQHKPLQSGRSLSSTYLSTEELTPIPNVTQLIFTKALDDIRRADWNLQCSGLTMMRRFTVFHPHYLVNSLQSVLMAVTSCMQSLRSSVMKNALLTFSDIVKTDCRELKALDAQLEPLTTEVLRLASGDNHFIRDAADECFHDVIQHISDHHRARLITRMLTSAMNSKNGTLKTRCIAVITEAVEVMDVHVFRHYSKMSLFIKSLSSFMTDAAEGTRGSARTLAELLLEKMSGLEAFTPLLTAHLTPLQLDAVGKFMGGGWADIQHPPTRTPPRSPAHTAMKSPRVARSPSKSLSPNNSNRPAKLSPSHVIPNGGSAPSSPYTTFTTKAPSSLDDTIPEAEHAATPALSELNVANARVAKCPGFKAAWGTPLFCEHCKMKKSAHCGDWESSSAASMNSRGSKPSVRRWRQVSSTPDYSRTPKVSPQRLNNTVPAVRSVNMSGRPPLKATSVSPSARASAGAGASASAGAGTETERMRMREEIEKQVKEEYAAKLDEKEEMIFSLLKDNMRLKSELEQAHKDLSKRVVDHVTFLTTPEFETEHADPSASSSTIEKLPDPEYRRSLSPENS